MPSALPWWTWLSIERGQQVVRGSERGEVAGEVQVDVRHGHDLRVAAAGGPALHPEDRSHRGLAQAGDRPVPAPVQGVREPDRGGRLPLARGGRRHPRHQDQLPERPVLEPGEVAEVHLRLVVPVGHEVRLLDPERLPRHLGDPPEVRRVRDLDVRRNDAHAWNPFRTLSRRSTCPGQDVVDVRASRCGAGGPLALAGSPRR